MDINLIRGITTVVLMLSFFGIVFWAYNPKRKKQFKDNANMIFDDDTQDHTQMEQRSDNVTHQPSQDTSN